MVLSHIETHINLR